MLKLVLLIVAIVIALAVGLVIALGDDPPDAGGVPTHQHRADRPAPPRLRGESDPVARTGRELRQRGPRWERIHREPAECSADGSSTRDGDVAAAGAAPASTVATRRGPAPLRAASAPAGEMGWRERSRP